MQEQRVTKCWAGRQFVAFVAKCGTRIQCVVNRDARMLYMALGNARMRFMPALSF